MESIVLENKNEKYYLFVDEVQRTKKVTDHENGDIDVTIYDMLNELKAYKNLDVYVTGSNSKELSNDIATEFRGRATQIHVFPMSFEEYYSFVGGDERKALDRYMLYGGMPRVLTIADETEKKEHLEVILDNDGNVIMTEGLVLQDIKYWEKFLNRECISHNHMTELYFEEKDIESFAEKLRNYPEPIEYVNHLMTHSWGQKVIRFYDPDGNLIEVGTPA